MGNDKRQMKFLHVFASDENNKFSNSFIVFIKENFDFSEHLFLLTEKKKKNNSIEQENTVSLPYNLRGTILFLIKAWKSEKLFFHGLSENKYITLGLILFPWILKKSYWLIWGGDIYDHDGNDQRSSFKYVIKRTLKRFFIKRFKGLITYIDGTYDVAVNLYGAQGTYYKCIMYPSNTVSHHSVVRGKKSDKKMSILVGSSALPRNQHGFLFEKIKQDLTDDYTAICPLSYGNSDYRNTVIEQGKKILGEHFTPITEFMDYKSYLNLLSEVDVAVYGHRKNQAMGNIISLISLGKKVYLRNDLTSWEALTGMGLKLYAINEEQINDDYPHDVRDNNIRVVRECFSNKALILQWQNIFTS